MAVGMAGIGNGALAWWGGVGDAVFGCAAGAATDLCGLDVCGDADWGLRVVFGPGTDLLFDSDADWFGATDVWGSAEAAV